MNVTDQKRTFSYSTFKSTMIPVKQAVLDAVNDYEESRQFPDLIPGCESNLLNALHEFEEHFPSDFPDRKWHVCIMQGMVASTLGRLETAAELDQASLEYAVTDEQRSISYLNLSEDFNHLRRFDAFLEAATRAYSLNPSHEGLICNLGLALAKTGQAKRAKSIIKLLIDRHHDEDMTSLFGAYTKYHDDMQELLSLL